MVLSTVAMSFVLFVQDGNISDLILSLSSDKPDTREAASRKILASWKEWTDQDLEKLRRAQNIEDKDAAARSREVLSHILMFRRIPQKVWQCAADAGPTLLNGSPDEVADLMGRLMSNWRSSQLPSKDLMTILYPLTRDSRPLHEAGTVQYAARLWVGDIVPQLPYDLPAEQFEQWWERNKSRTEVDWFLPSLDSQDNSIRATSIQRLFRIGTVELWPKLFASLRGIQEANEFSEALEGIPTLPREIMEREFACYFKDPRLGIRFAVVKKLMPHHPTEAIGYLLDGLENPAIPRNSELSPVILDWLLVQKDDRILPVIRKVLMTDHDQAAKKSILCALADLSDPQVDEIIAESLWDTHGPPVGEEWLNFKNRINITNSRVCDMAAIVLSERLRVVGSFSWELDFVHRDENLLNIWKIYRERKKLPPAPFLPLQFTLADPGEVETLTRMLASKDAKERSGAIKSCSRLGIRAWSLLKSRTNAENGAVRKSLEEALVTIENCVTGVESDSEAEPSIKYLRDHLNEPFDLKAFIRSVVKPWIEDPRLCGFQLSFERDTLGRGITLEIRFTRTPANAPPFDELRFTKNTPKYCKLTDDEVLRYIQERIEPQMSVVSSCASTFSMEMHKLSSRSNKSQR